MAQSADGGCALLQPVVPPSSFSEFVLLPQQPCCYRHEDSHQDTSAKVDVMSLQVPRCAFREICPSRDQGTNIRAPNDPSGDNRADCGAGCVVDGPGECHGCCSEHAHGDQEDRKVSDSSAFDADEHREADNSKWH